MNLKNPVDFDYDSVSLRAAEVEGMLRLINNRWITPEEVLKQFERILEAAKTREYGRLRDLRDLENEGTTA